MIEAIVLVFVTALLMAGWILIDWVKAAGEPEPDGDEPQIWEPARAKIELKEARVMERRRFNIWWKIDRLYADFLEQTSGLSTQEPEERQKLVAGNPLEADPFAGLAVSQITDAFTEWRREMHS